METQQVDLECQPTSPTLTTASAPFNKSTDLVLRSSDMVDFHVWTVMLKEASPMFDAMLSIPQPVADPEHDVPVVHVTEDSKTLRGILELCYPMAPSIIQEKNIDVVLHIIEAALKYSMEWPVALVEQSLKELAGDQPLRVYAIAQRHRMPELAQFAAHASLRYSFPGEYCPELEDITGGAYYRLVKYHENCARAVGAVMQETAWMGRRNQYTWFSCQNVKCGPPPNGRYILEGYIPKAWFAVWMDGVLADLRKRPCKETASTTNIETVSMNLGCPNCKAKAHIDLTKFRVLLAEEVEKQLAKASTRFLNYFVAYAHQVFDQIELEFR
ncbi:hypothetical protein BXZ70DRAFT_389357 [Cristinia sonorae]|uniref:BTB domain-containing protein n=1 Tax=Cristinia sonorae TaxID=1940300 RepID=A0A8K0XMX8_9AGAR|nr:hypothetical protein BXZ70DRAFT_389357 [Cristinia sonorae]